ncbi:MAG: response regulator transcription factor [Actinobacteria bacterium]|nr:MAG: response regulator transcription factor [Actinomycetota bacterium]
MIRVVVVDDDSHLRDLFKMMLELEDGFEVVGEAGDGKAAISRVEECQPDLVMLDLEMPVMDGLEALPRILEAAPRTKVVVVSGFPEDSLEARALAAGAVAYVSKGLSVEALVRQLASVVEDEGG